MLLGIPTEESLDVSSTGVLPSVPALSMAFDYDDGFLTPCRIVSPDSAGPTTPNTATPDGCHTASV